jgi:hypothetical protein
MLSYKLPNCASLDPNESFEFPLPTSGGLSDNET